MNEPSDAENIAFKAALAVHRCCNKEDLTYIHEDILHITVTIWVSSAASPAAVLLCCCCMLLQLASATLGLACYLVSNALVVSPAACADAATRRAIYWLAFVRWTCWNTTFLLTTIKVCHTRPGPCLLKCSLSLENFSRFERVKHILTLTLKGSRTP